MTPPQTAGSGTRDATGVRVPAPRHSWDPPAAPPPRARTRRRRVREVLGTLMVLSLIPLVALVGVNLHLVNRLDRIDGAFDGLRDRPRRGRPSCWSARGPVAAPTWDGWTACSRSSR